MSGLSASCTITCRTCRQRHLVVMPFSSASMSILSLIICASQLVSSSFLGLFDNFIFLAIFSFPFSYNLSPFTGNELKQYLIDLSSNFPWFLAIPLCPADLRLRGSLRRDWTSIFSCLSLSIVYHMAIILSSLFPKKKGIILNFFQSFFDYFFRKCYTFGRKEMIEGWLSGKGKLGRIWYFRLSFTIACLLKQRRSTGKSPGWSAGLWKNIWKSRKKRRVRSAGLRHWYMYDLYVALLIDIMLSISCITGAYIVRHDIYYMLFYCLEVYIIWGF